MSTTIGTISRKVANAKPAPAGYSGTPLPRKLGIKVGMKVRTFGAPEEFEELLGELPDGVRLLMRAEDPDLTIWFVRRLRELQGGIRIMARECPAGGMWIAWPKQSSTLAGDVKESHVRAAGLEHGLVDYKVCAVSADWSGLKFAVRREPRPKSWAKKTSRTRRSAGQGRAADTQE